MLKLFQFLLFLCPGMGGPPTRRRGTRTASRGTGPRWIIRKSNSKVLKVKIGWIVLIIIIEDKCCIFVWIKVCYFCKKKKKSQEFLLSRTVNQWRHDEEMKSHIFICFWSRSNSEIKMHRIPEQRKKEEG